MVWSWLLRTRRPSRRESRVGPNAARCPWTAKYTVIQSLTIGRERTSMSTGTTIVVKGTLKGSGHENWTHLGDVIGKQPNVAWAIMT